MPDVLRVIARLNQGGPARHVIRIDAPLRRAGWRTVLATGRVGPGEQDLVDEARGAGLDVRLIPGLGRAPRLLDDLRAWRHLSRLARQLQPDVVHTHTAKAGTLGRLATGARVAHVHTFHGHVLDGYFGPLGSAACRAVERGLAVRTDAFVAVSARIRDELRDAHGVGRSARWEVVPPGIDFARTAPDALAGRALRDELGLAPGDVLAGWVGRLAPVKDLELALEAHARVGEQRLHLLVVGDGSEGPAFRTRLPGLARVHWLAPRARLGSVYGALDLLLLSSRHEGLPQVVVESLAAGLPIVATAVGGVPELVRQGSDGLLVPPRDPVALAAALRLAVTEPGRLAALAAAAAARDLSEHRSAAVAAHLARLYDDLAGRKLEARTRRRHAAASCGSSS